jgi:gas vesicle protein
MTTGKVILGVVAGLAAGAVLGVLFAPGKGIDTRNKIARKGKDLTDELNHTIEHKFDELMKAVSGKLGHVKNDKEPRKPEMAEL